MRWFVTQFGRNAAVGEITTPASPLLPAPFTRTQEQIETMVAWAYDVMCVEVTEAEVRVFGVHQTSDVAPRTSGTKRRVGHHQIRNGRPVIDLDIETISDAP